MDDNTALFGIDLGKLEKHVELTESVAIPLADLARRRVRTLTDRLASAAADRDAVPLSS